MALLSELKSHDELHKKYLSVTQGSSMRFPGFVDRAHAALTELFEDFVVGDGLPITIYLSGFNILHRFEEISPIP